MRRTILALPALLLAAACGGGETEEGTDAAAAMPPAAPAQVVTDTTDAALWSHIQADRYREWAHWPNTGDLYTGGEPHGMLLTTYVNDVAARALAAGATTLPAGAIVVKENYMPDSTFAAITAMSKVPGYNPAAGDWFWAKWDPMGVPEVSGRVEGCIACHAQGSAADWLLTAR